MQVRRKVLIYAHSVWKWTEFSKKTLWDWLQLLLIPLVLTAAGLAFSTCQHNSDQQRALDQQQATILQTYIDNIQDLLLNHDLLKHKLGDDVAILARARTLTALQGLDPERKGLLVQFLYEAKLIGFEIFYPPGVPPGPGVKSPIIFLGGARLDGARLDGAELVGVNLSGVYLNNADLSGAGLNDAYLHDANLNGANLNGAYLYGARLDGAHLNNANLDSARLDRAHLVHADLISVNLDGARLDSAYNLTQQQLDQVYSCQNATLPPGLTCHRNRGTTGAV